MPEITRDLLRDVQESMNEALTVVAEAHGLKSLTAGKCVYDERAGNFTFKVLGLTTSGVDSRVATYNARRGFLNLPPINTAFEFRGEGYVIAGMSGRSRKVDIIRASDRQPFRLDVDSVRTACEEAAATKPAKKGKANAKKK